MTIKKTSMEPTITLPRNHSQLSYTSPYEFSVSFIQATDVINPTTQNPTEPPGKYSFPVNEISLCSVLNRKLVIFW